MKKTVTHGIGIKTKRNLVICQKQTQAFCTSKNNKTNKIDSYNSRSQTNHLNIEDGQITFILFKLKSILMKDAHRKKHYANNLLIDRFHTLI